MSLSARAHQAEQINKNLILWQIVSDLWDAKTNPNGYVSLGVAENTLLHDVLLKHIQDNIALPESALTYGDGPTGTSLAKASVARFLNKHFSPVTPLEARNITLTNGCSAAIEHLSWAVANPGEGILVGQPFYGTFVPDLTARFGGKFLPVPFHEIDPLGEEAVSKYEDVILAAQATGVKPCALVISNPHNPLGRCYSRSALIGLMKLCQKYQLHFISDEIYGLSVWDNVVDEYPPAVPFESALSIDPTGIIDPALVHVLWGMSKDFGANGIRVGAIISQANHSLHSSLAAVGLYSYVSSISDHITVNLLDDDAFVDSYIVENRRKLSEQYQRVTTWAKKHNITYAPGANAAFFLWVDLGTAYKAAHNVPESEDISSLITDKLLDTKVFISSGKDYGSEKPGWFRIVFSHENSFLDRGLGRIVEALAKAP